MPTEKNLIDAWNLKYSDDNRGMTEVINYMRKVPPTFRSDNYLKRYISTVNKRRLVYKNDTVLHGFYGNLKNALQSSVGLYEKRKKEGPVSMEEFAKMVNNLEEAASRATPIEVVGQAFSSYKAGLYKPLRNYKTSGALPKNKRYATKVTTASKLMNQFFNKPFGQGAKGLPASVNKLYRGMNNKFPVPANGVVNNKSYSSWTSNKSVANAFTKSNRGLIFVMNKNKFGNTPFEWFQEYGRKDPESEYILPPLKFTIGTPYMRNGRRYANVTSKVMRGNRTGAPRRAATNNGAGSSRQAPRRAATNNGAGSSRQAPRRSARLQNARGTKN
jgi:hypothetical protein